MIEVTGNSALGSSAACESSDNSSDLEQTVFSAVSGSVDVTEETDASRREDTGAESSEGVSVGFSKSSGDAGRSIDSEVSGRVVCSVKGIDACVATRLPARSRATRWTWTSLDVVSARLSVIWKGTSPRTQNF